jgi:capsular exopolysaccharide synthesis family protein
MIKLNTAIGTTEAKLQGEILKVVQSVKNEFLSAQAQEHQLAGALEQKKSEALALSSKGIDYAVLKREAESNNLIYNTLLQRAKETGVSAELKTSNIRVVDSAETQQIPIRPKKMIDLLLALFGGGLLAAGLAFFFEYIDNRIKSPDEIKAHLGLPFLGLIPAIKLDSHSGASPMINNGVPANFAEAFRTVRTNVLFSSAEEGGRSLVVTSTAPGEGKTLVATNVAMALAQAGQRVLLVDADMRRPRVHEVFDMSQQPGLSNLLTGNCKASESVRKSATPGLWVLSAGDNPPNPAELVGSHRFKDLLASLTAHFDWVIIDSPPVLAVTDAALAAHRASGVLFVIGSEMTSRNTAMAALEQIQSAKAKVVGAVLNRVNVERNSYYYSHYYHRNYSNYYSNGSAQR